MAELGKVLRLQVLQQNEVLTTVVANVEKLKLKRFLQYLVGLAWHGPAKVQ
jgi:hypothetical protein